MNVRGGEGCCSAKRLGTGTSDVTSRREREPRGHLGEEHSGGAQGGRGTAKGDEAREDTVRMGPDPRPPLRTVLT